MYPGILSPEVSLLSYMGNAGGFESEVSIHWFLEGRLLRQSGGQIPKGGWGWCEVLDSLTLVTRCYPEILATEHLENCRLDQLGASGFSMFVDRLSKLTPGRWRVTLTDTRTGHRTGMVGMVETTVIKPSKATMVRWLPFFWGKGEAGIGNFRCFHRIGERPFIIYGGDVS